MKLVLIDDELEHPRLYAHIADPGKWKRLCRSRQGVLTQMSQVAGQDGLGTREIAVEPINTRRDTAQLWRPGDQACPCSEASILNVAVKCRLRPLDMAKSSPSRLQRERYVSRCGAKPERKGKNVFRYPRPLEATVPQNEVYHRRCSTGQRDFWKIGKEYPHASTNCTLQQVQEQSLVLYATRFKPATHDRTASRQSK